MVMPMIKIDKHIEIVRSSTTSLSSLSQKSCDAILAVLAKHYAKVGVTTVNNLSGLEALVACGPDLVFLGMKFIPVNPELGLQDPDKIWITEYLDAHGIAYTGSDQRAHELESNKPLAKQRVLDMGLQTSPYYVVRQNQPQTVDKMTLAFPLFVKPTDRGCGIGVDSDSVVHNFEQLRSKIQLLATDLRADALIEKYLPGREFSVAILKVEDSASYMVMPLERVAPADEHGVRILSPEVKLADAGSSVKVTDKIIKAKVTALAINVFHALGARDYGRIDIRLDEFGTPQFLEANLLPSLISGYGNFPKACVLNIGLNHEQMILTIVRLGLTRNLKMTAVELDKDKLFAPAFEAALVLNEVRTVRAGSG